MSIAVVFDLDDTLYLERDYVRSGIEAIAAWLEPQGLDGDAFTSAAWHTFEHGGSAMLQDGLGAAGGEPDRLLDDAIAVYRGHHPTIELLPGVGDMLDGLRRRRVPMALLTDGRPDGQQRKVQALGLGPIIPTVVYGWERGPAFGKPDPWSFERCEQALGGDRFAYIADNPRKDFITPHRRGWLCVRVRHHQGLHAGLDSGEDVDHETISVLDAVRHAVPELH